MPFQENPDTGDARISGTLASLAGLEQAIQSGNDLLIDLAVRRILMIHSIILSIGGIPLIYLGDELATLNDYSYANDPAKAGDSRWVHRPQTDWARAKSRHDPATRAGWVFAELTRLIRLRQEQPAFWDGEMEVAESANPHIFSFVRQHGGQRVLVLANFSEYAQLMDENQARVYGVGYSFTDLISGQTRTAEKPLRLEPYQYLWLSAS